MKKKQPMSYYPDAEERQIVSEISFEQNDIPHTKTISQAVRAFGRLFKENRAHALELAMRRRREAR